MSEEQPQQQQEENITQRPTQRPMTPIEAAITNAVNAFMWSGGFPRYTVSTVYYIGQQEYRLTVRSGESAEKALSEILNVAPAALDMGFTPTPQWPEDAEVPDGFEPKPTPGGTPPSQRKTQRTQQRPAPRQQRSGNADNVKIGNWTIFRVRKFKRAVTENGKDFCKVFGGPFQKYGVKAWEEVMDTVSQNWARWSIGSEKSPPNAIYAAVDEGAQYKKVAFFASSIEEAKDAITGVPMDDNAPAGAEEIPF